MYMYVSSFTIKKKMFFLIVTSCTCFTSIKYSFVKRKKEKKKNTKLKQVNTISNLRYGLNITDTPTIKTHTYIKAHKWNG